jgi:hypothetical protein
MAKLTTFVIMSALLAGPVQQTFPVGVEAMQDCAKNNFFAIPGNLGCFGDHVIASGKKYIPKFLVPEKQ